jgi:hypothetical protein
VTVEGGEGTPRASIARPISLGGESAGFGVEEFTLSPEDENGAIDTQAGSHPFQLTTRLDLNRAIEANPDSRENEPSAPALVRDLHFVLPPGLLGNINVVPQCSGVQFATILSGDINQCSPETAVGVAKVTLNEPHLLYALSEAVPIFNLTPEPGEPARFGIEIDKVPVILGTAVRTGKDYAVEVTTRNTTEAAILLDSDVTFWGVPADPRHNSSRGWECLIGGVWTQSFGATRPCVAPHEPRLQSFITLPTSCGQTARASVSGDSWAQGAGNREVATLTQSSPLPSPFTGCNLLGFAPVLGVESESRSASTPTGFEVDVAVPQEATLSATGLAEADVQRTELVLPEGLEASPAAANGLLTCSNAQAGFAGALSGGALQAGANEDFDAAELDCPEEAKIGTVRISTPLLKNELKGFAYLASQDTEPFASPLVLYIGAFDKSSGVRVKLAGEVRIDQATGRLTSVFDGTPPVPFEHLRVDLFGGPGATQSTPALCGSYPATATFSPSTGAPSVASSDSFTIDSGAGGGPCETSLPQPLTPSLLAGSEKTTASAFTAFELTLGHGDGDQPISGLSVHLPEGVAAVLAHVTPCAEPSPAAEWSCGPESLLGEASTSSGLGGSPVTLPGSAYLTQGYDGAPFGLLVATRAKAGPFDLGMVYVRSRIDVDPNTAAVTITTDGGPHHDVLPTRLRGVPVALKEIHVVINRPEFQFNPTNCEPKSVAVDVSGSQGTVASTSVPFQVSNCSGLAFHPKLTASVKARASKRNGAAFHVTVTSAGLGQANIHKVKLELPQVLPSRLQTLNEACDEKVFDVNPATCNPHAFVGRATIHTPVLKSPLTGPAILVSHGGAAFPDLEFLLQGEGITLILDGRTFINDKTKITSSKFETTPDAPFTKFETEFPEGPFSVLGAYNRAAMNHYDLCGANLKMPTEIVGQNGAVLKTVTKVAGKGCTTAVKRASLASSLHACAKLRTQARRAACALSARAHFARLRRARRAVRARRG